MRSHSCACEMSWNQTANEESGADRAKGARMGEGGLSSRRVVTRESARAEVRAKGAGTDTVVSKMLLPTRGRADDVADAAAEGSVGSSGAAAFGDTSGDGSRSGRGECSVLRMASPALVSPSDPSDVDEPEDCGRDPTSLLAGEAVVEESEDDAAVVAALGSTSRGPERMMGVLKNSADLLAACGAVLGVPAS